MEVLVVLTTFLLTVNSVQQHPDLGDIKDQIEVIDYEINGEDLLQNFKMADKALIMKGAAKKWPLYKALRDREVFKETLQDVKVKSAMLHHESYGGEETTVGDFIKEGLYGAKFDVTVENDGIKKLLHVPTPISSCKKMFDDFTSSHRILLTGIKSKIRADVMGSCIMKDMFFTVMSGSVKVQYFGKKKKAFMHSGDLAYFPRGQCFHLKSNGTFIGVLVSWNNSASDGSGCERPTTYSKTVDMKMTDTEWKMMSEPDELPDKVLNTGFTIPAIGLGTARLFSDTYNAVLNSLDLGYRMLDTAQIYSGEDDYENFVISSEEEVGRALQDSNVQREDVFLVTKLSPDFTSYEDAIERIENSMKNLQTDYLDLLLVHDFFSDECGVGDKTGKCKKSRWEAWRSLEEMQSRGVVRSIGVSNIFPRDLKSLIEVSKSKVSVVQNWFDPLHQDREIRKLCLENKIVYMGYSNLGKMWTDDLEMNENPVTKNPTLIDIAVNHDLPVTSVVLRWALDRESVIIPCSTDPEHQEINLNVRKQFLLEGALERIDSLDNLIGNPDERTWKDPYKSGGSPQGELRDEL